MDLEKKSLSELKALQAQAAKALAAREQVAKNEAKRQIVEIAREAGLRVQFLATGDQSSPDRSRSTPKYRNPSTGQPVTIPARKRARFREAAELRRLLNPESTPA